jgi:hypothetical protein
MKRQGVLDQQPVRSTGNARGQSTGQSFETRQPIKAIGKRTPEGAAIPLE